LRKILKELSKKIICILKIVIYIFFVSDLYSQESVNLGTPQIFNFEKKTYSGGNQSWKVHIDKKGFTWFANNAGVLRTDGSTWTFIPSPNGTIARSVDVDDSRNIVYAGFQGEFGFFQLGKHNKYIYTSLAAKLNGQYGNFSDVWDVIVRANDVFFRTDNHVFRYFNGQLTKVKVDADRLNFMGRWHGDLVLQDSQNNLYLFDGQSFVARKTNAVFDKGRITAVLSYTKDTTLITTIDNGIFYESVNGFLPWKTNDDPFLKKNIIFCADVLPNGRLALGTSFSGLVLIDTKHRLQLILNKRKGLQNNSVLSIKSNEMGQVWLGLDRGIDLADLNSAFNSFYPDQEIQGSAYAAIDTKGKYYFGTNTGLYAVDRKSFYNPVIGPQFSKVENSNGQVWSLGDIDGNIIMGHHNGAYLIEGNQATKIAGSPNGVWKFLKLSAHHYVVGAYSGLHLCEVNGKTIKFTEKIKGFDESARILYKDEAGNVWIAHPYRGIYCWQPSQQTVTDFTKKYPSLNNMVYKVGNNIVVEDKSTLYTIDATNMSLKQHPKLARYINVKEGLRYLQEDKYGNVWYSTKNESAILMPKSGTSDYVKYQLPTLKDKWLDGFQMVHAVEQNYFIIGTDKGFMTFNPIIYTAEVQRPKVFLSEVKTNSPKDSVLFLASPLNVFGNAEIDVKYSDSNIRLKYGINTQEMSENNLYSHYLAGSDVAWSEWSSNQMIIFNKLSPGTHQLYVKVKNPQGVESTQMMTTINVSPPWYKSIFAILIYILIALMLLYYWYSNLKQKHKKEKIRLVEKNMALKQQVEKDATIAQAEIIRLQNEKLKAEIQYKNKELTSFTYNLVEKNELIQAIRSLITNLEKRLKDNPELKKELKQIHKLTEQNSHEEEEWSTFIASFDEVHADFFKRLNAEFKDLSPTDYKMCTYLRMNLSSKEIASLMNISIRSVETNRYRLRKKLNLSSETNLTQYIMMY
jgi:DNA-binding CsgD family transcriptional regulator/ligand-binding sensor domain-containing protein